METVEELENAFEPASWQAVEKCRSFNSHPTVWISMMREVGAAEAARRLLATSDLQSGFERLIREGSRD
jgi:hypothetical protein